jgi:hypothetical protein
VIDRPINHTFQAWPQAARPVAMPAAACVAICACIRK